MRMKLYFLPLMGMVCGGMQAQVIIQENFENLAIGNLDSQLGISTEGGVSYDYQVSTSVSGKDIHILSGATGGDDSNRLALFPPISDSWNTRNQGNILQVTFDIFTQTSPNSQTYGGVTLQEIDGSQKIEGISILYSADSRNLKVRYFDGTDVVEEIITDAGGQPVVLPENRWVKLGFAYDTNTSTVVVKGAGFSKTIQGVEVFIDEIGFIVRPYHSANTSSALYRFDNLKVEAVAVENILSTREEAVSDVLLEVFPNPSTGYVKISSPEKIEKVSMYDMAGKKMEVSIENDTIDIHSFPSGGYFLVVQTASKQYTKRILKK